MLFEAPARVLGTLNDLATHCGGSRRVAVARELTKLHEQIWRGTLDEARSWADETTVRGEVVLVVEGSPPPATPVVEDAEVVAAIASHLEAGERTRGAVDTVAAPVRNPTPPGSTTWPWARRAPAGVPTTGMRSPIES